MPLDSVTVGAKFRLHDEGHLPGAPLRRLLPRLPYLFGFGHVSPRVIILTDDVGERKSLGSCILREGDESLYAAHFFAPRAFRRFARAIEITATKPRSPPARTMKWKLRRLMNKCRRVASKHAK
jgi:hypothetical protein